VEHKKSKMVLVLVKVRHMNMQRMLAMKCNLKNNLQVIKMSKKITMRMQIKNKKMIFKWKLTLMEKCIQSKNRMKMMKTMKQRRNKQMKKWVMSMIKNVSKI